MKYDTCQNCGETVTAKYCADCGQKTDTHRFSTRHVFTHDIIHGVFHLDKGFAYTAKELLTRPGYAIREYVDGKRVKHFHYVTFLMIVATFNIFINTHSTFRLSFMYDGLPEQNTWDLLQEFAHHHVKLILLLQIPVNALITGMVFKKANQHYAEHLVMNTYKEAGYLMLNTIIIFLLSFVNDKHVIKIVVLSTLPLIFVYSAIFYSQYFRKDYANKGVVILKSVFALMIVPLITMLVAYIITYYSYDKLIVIHLLRGLSIEHYLIF